jgi:hypothetical protein
MFNIALNSLLNFINANIIEPIQNKFNYFSSANTLLYIQENILPLLRVYTECYEDYQNGYSLHGTRIIKGQAAIAGVAAPAA